MAKKEKKKKSLYYHPEIFRQLISLDVSYWMHNWIVSTKLLST